MVSVQNCSKYALSSQEHSDLVSLDVLVGCTCLSCTFSFNLYVCAAVCLTEAWGYQPCVEAGVQLLTLASAIPQVPNSSCPCYSLTFFCQEWPSDVVVDEKEGYRCAVKNWNISKPAPDALKPSLTKENYPRFTITPSWCHILAEQLFSGMKPRESKISSTFSDEHLENSENGSHLWLLRCSTAALLYVKTVKVFLCAGADSPVLILPREDAAFCWDGYWPGLGQVNNDKNESVVLVLFLSGVGRGVQNRGEPAAAICERFPAPSWATKQVWCCPEGHSASTALGHESCPPCSPKQLQGGQATWGNPRGHCLLWSSSSTPVTFNLEIFKTAFMFCSGLKSSLEAC